MVERRQRYVQRLGLVRLSRSAIAAVSATTITTASTAAADLASFDDVHRAERPVHDKRGR